MVIPESAERDDTFTELFAAVEDDLARAFGVAIGAEVMSDVTAWAWEHRARVTEMKNPAGYLFRVGQSAARRYTRWSSRNVGLQDDDDLAVNDQPSIDPGLDAALARLNDDQRVAVVMVHGYGMSYAEAADLIGVPVTTLRNRLRRGLQRLRSQLEVHDDA